MFTKDGKVLVFNKPQITVNIQANTTVVRGKHTARAQTEADLFENLDPATLQRILQATKAGAGAAPGSDDVPELVGDFEQAAEVNADAEAAKPSEAAQAD